MKRIAIPRKEADYWAEKVAAEHWSDDAPATRSLGLYTWTPQPWDSHVDDPNRNYYFWAYALEWSDPDAAMWDAPQALIVGTSPKGGDNAAGEGDVEVEEFDTVEEALEGTKRTTTSHLRKSGLSDVEILAILP